LFSGTATTVSGNTITVNGWIDFQGNALPSDNQLREFVGWTAWFAYSVAGIPPQVGRWASKVVSYTETSVTLEDMPVVTGLSGNITAVYLLPYDVSGGLDGASLRAELGMVAADLDDQLDDLADGIAACGSIVASSSDATAAGAITRRRGNTWSIALTLGAVTDYTSLWFTVKRSYDDADSAALLHVKLNSPSVADGLLYVNGAAATDATKASITVSNAGTGAIVVAVDETITDDLAPGTYYYDAQVLITGAVTTPDSGTFTITADVTRSVT
jgi:hypothetical protein